MYKNVFFRNTKLFPSGRGSFLALAVAGHAWGSLMHHGASVGPGRAPWCVLWNAGMSILGLHRNVGMFRMGVLMSTERRADGRTELLMLTNMRVKQTKCLVVLHIRAQLREYSRRNRRANDNTACCWCR